jgi:D-methionine transport system permease protein
LTIKALPVNLMIDPSLLPLLLQSLWQTLYMVLVAGLIASILGIPLGVLLYLTQKDQLLAQPLLNKLMSVVVNVGRSFPFIILLIAIIPFTRWLVGTSIGTNAVIVPLTIAAVPFIARLVEGAIMEVPRGLIEAAQTMGATPLQIITKVLLAEALPGIVNSITITLIALVNYSAMAGAVGGGGLGDLAIRYGYQRFDVGIMIITVVILIVLVQLIQSIGDYLVNHFNHKA